MKTRSGLTPVCKVEAVKRLLLPFAVAAMSQFENHTAAIAVAASDVGAP